MFSAWGNSGVPEATRLVDISLEAGLNMFDSADVYSDGLAEEILGKAIAGRRDKVLISTKATFRRGDGANDVGSSRFHLINAVERALKRLGTDYIDLFQLHAFDAVTPVEETLSTLDDLVRAGKIRYVGCSNFSGWHLMKSLAVSEKYGYARYVAHQAYYSLIGRSYEWELMPLASPRKMASPFLKSRSTGCCSARLFPRLSLARAMKNNSAPILEPSAGNSHPNRSPDSTLPVTLHSPIPIGINAYSQSEIPRRFNIGVRFVEVPPTQANCVRANTASRGN